MDLRPSLLDDLGLVPALETYVQNFEKRHGMEVCLKILGDFNERFDPCIETCVYRIVQESLTNIAKHSNARMVSLFLENKGKHIRGGIEDDGIGFKPDETDVSRSMGLYGMRERVLLLGGVFRIDSDEGVGTMITFEIPLKPGNCHE